MDNVLTFAKKLLKEKIDKNSIVVDATCGNGNDTLFLAKTSAKKVFAFDIQEQAIFNTRQLLRDNELESKCELILDSHFNFDNYIKSKVRAVMFNLGYLPKGNHNITTTADTTVTTIKKFLKVLEIGGIVVIVVYWGHENGKIEKTALLDMVTALNQHNVEVLQYQFINQKNNAPFVIALEKKKEF
ncbi:putative rRNA methylase [Gemella bergeri ATCC 700627]|uniref:Putative rRNA methylase n=1 Tax=Gemella bergeri ATCC 700627 TaxID=1321820 RepID=U2RXY7_9BACL|nr:class I SAM-dependent methyltransferase [Gemella bergeri]ERK58403.1 putative rRNA methylase [Gemella bergeri ATCC 700627]